MVASPPVYLDYSATTPVDERVLQAMLPWLGARFGNPASSSHAYGWDAEDAVERARAQVAALIGADPREIIWTSGATESDNLAIKGVAEFHRDRGRHIVTVATEHKAVLDPCHDLQRQGFEVTVLPVDAHGLLDPEALRAALRPDTILASVMLVNNEIGVVQDIAALAAICHEHGVLFHSDAAQATGKVAIDVRAMDVDLPDDWFATPEAFMHKGYDEKKVMIEALRGPITMEMVLQEINRYADSEFRYTDKSDDAAVSDIIRRERQREKAIREMEAMKVEGRW